MITRHGLMRVTQRLGIPEAFVAVKLRQMWQSARMATFADFVVFGASEYADKEYRVSDDRQYLLVKSRTTRKFVTVLCRR